jgi:hypothetical protein
MSKLRSFWPTSCALLVVLVLSGCRDGGKGPRREDEAPPSLDAAVDNASAQTDAALRPDSGVRGDAAPVASPRPDDAGSDAGIVADAKAPSAAPGTDGGVPATDYEAWLLRVDKLRGCGVVGEGAYPFFLPFHQRCESLCIVAASCEQLKSEACEQEPAESLEACFDGCSEDIVTCGDGQKVPSDAACDVKPDCKNGEDEKHCEIFQCASGGDKVGGFYRCDGEKDCEDGSDELGCALLCGQSIANDF